jgi:hypothetical protein
MRTHMLARTSIIAQTLTVQRNKKSIAAIMLVSYAGSRGQSSRSSTTFRTTRSPPPANLGFASFWLGSVAIVRLVRLAGGFALMACNQSSTRFTARPTWDGLHGVPKSRSISGAISAAASHADAGDARSEAAVRELPGVSWREVERPGCFLEGSRKAVARMSTWG